MHPVWKRRAQFGGAYFVGGTAMAIVSAMVDQYILDDTEPIPLDSVGGWVFVLAMGLLFGMFGFVSVRRQHLDKQGSLRSDQTWFPPW